MEDLSGKRMNLKIENGLLRWRAPGKCQPPKVTLRGESMEIYLIRIANDGAQTFWNLTKDSETGLILIDINTGLVELNHNYTLNQDRKSKRNKGKSQPPNA